MAFVKIDLSSASEGLLASARKLKNDITIDEFRLNPALRAKVKAEIVNSNLNAEQLDILSNLANYEGAVLTGIDISSYSLPSTPKNDNNLPDLPDELTILFSALTIPSNLVITQNSKELIGTTLQHVYPEPGKEQDHSSRGIYELSEHTDEPIFEHPAIMTALYCLRGDPNGATGIIPLSKILARLDSETIEQLTQPIFIFESGKTYKKHELFEDRILFKTPEENCGYRIKFHNNSRTTSKTKEGSAALESLREAIVQARQNDAFEHTLMPGNILFITNIYGLHYRKQLSSSVSSDERRWCLRVRLNTQQY